MNGYRSPGPLVPLIHGRRRLLPVTESPRSEQPPRGEPGRLCVVTLNTWKGEGSYEARVDAMAACLDALSPDLVALQEVLAIPARGVNTAYRLARLLDMYAAFHPARDKYREMNGQMVLSQSGMAVLSRNPITASRAVALPSAAEDGERIAQLVTVDTTIGGIALLNLHLTHLPDADALRRTQMTAALKALSSSRHGPCIATGDFNAFVDEPWLHPVATETGMRFRNLRRRPSSAAVIPTLIGAPEGSGEAACVDHILLADPANSASFDVSAFAHSGSAAMSDHFAVCATLTAVA